MDENRLLATERGIPWKLPRDVAHFRAYTSGKWLLLGRRTFEEMKGWFQPHHTPLVLSTRCSFDPQGARGVDSVPHALALAEAAGQSELVVCGGAQTYAAALPYADKLLLTHVAHRFDPSAKPVHFPEWNPAEWKVTSEVHLTSDDQHLWPAIIKCWDRSRPR